MLEQAIPEVKLEPWHAVFTADSTEAAAAYRCASTYGKLLVDNGFAKQYLIISVVKGRAWQVNCIPNSTGDRHIMHYWGRLVDSKG